MSLSNGYSRGIPSKKHTKAPLAGFDSLQSLTAGLPSCPEVLEALPFAAVRRVPATLRVPQGLRRGGQISFSLDPSTNSGFGEKDGMCRSPIKNMEIGTIPTSILGFQTDGRH